MVFHHGDLVANAPHVPVHLGSMSDSVRTALREGKPCREVLRNYRKDGSQFWADIIGYAIEYKGRRYSLGYVSNDPATDGAWRQVTVTLSESRPELQQLRVRAREGYFAPYFEDGAPVPR